MFYIRKIRSFQSGQNVMAASIWNNFYYVQFCNFFDRFHAFTHFHWALMVATKKKDEKRFRFSLAWLKVKNSTFLFSVELHSTVKFKIVFSSYFTVIHKVFMIDGNFLSIPIWYHYCIIGFFW